MLCYEVLHCVGGPVARDEWATLHRFGDVPGAQPLGGGLYVDGSLAELRQRALHASGNGTALVQVIYGHAAWATGQLEGEIRAGAWRWAPELGRRFALDEHFPSAWLRANAAVAAAAAPQG